jgi:hypothetical protein
MQGGFGGEIPQLVIQAHGFAPVSDGAARVLLGRLSEGLLDLLVLKGMQQGHALFYRFLRGGCAGTGEIHPAQRNAGRGGLRRRVGEPGSGKQERKRQQDSDGGNASHGGSLLRSDQTGREQLS